MSSILKSFVVGLLITALTFSPVLMGMAQAGGINFEGISLVKTDYAQRYEKQPRGLMFNFSFGAPKDYKNIMKLNGIHTSMLDENNENNDKSLSIVLGVLAIGVVALMLYGANNIEIE